MRAKSLVICVTISLLAGLLGSCSTQAAAPTALASPSPTGIPAEAVSSTPTVMPTTAAPTPTQETSFIKAIALNNFGPRLDTKDARLVMQKSIVPAGANTVALMPTCWSETYSDKTIVCSDKNDPRMIPPVSDEELIAAIRYAHNLGLHVYLKPQALVRQPQITQHYAPRGQTWNEADWTAWFDSYIAFITHYAQMAEENQVELLTIGQEQDDTLTHESDWRRVIAAVRAVYHGKITYNVGAWDFLSLKVPFWDAVDYIGVQGYFGMVDKLHPTIAEMVSAWQPMIERMSAWSKQYDKPVLLSEIGYRSARGFNLAWLKGKGDFIKDPYEAEGQADYYRAFFEALKGQPWLAGIVLWDVYTNPFAEGPGDISFSFIGKPAEQVVHEYFGGMPMDTRPTAELVQDPEHSAMIYSDNLVNGWKMNNYAGTLEIPYIYFKNPHNGRFSIQVPLSKNPDLVLVRDEAMDMSKYKWLEFYILAGKRPPGKLKVAMASWYNEVHAWYAMTMGLMIADPAYLEGGAYTAGTWQKVTIPLSDLGVGTQEVSELHIGLCFYNCGSVGAVDDIYVDDMSLVPAKP